MGGQRVLAGERVNGAGLAGLVTQLAPVYFTIGCEESGGNLDACCPAASAGAGAQRDSRRLSIFSKTRAGSSPMRKKG